MDAGQTILVVEDDELVRTFLGRALTRGSWTVDACADGAAALAAVRARTYAVMLLDGLLPDMHGVDLAGRVIDHENGRRSGICFVTGTLRQGISMRSGITALPKPLRLQELTAAVDGLLQWREADEEPLDARRAALQHVGSGLLVA